MQLPALIVLLGLWVVALGGCSLGGDEDSDATGSQSEAQPKGAPVSESRIIRAWSSALNRGDIRRAASFFARGALVEQQREFRLPDRAAAIAFNRSLPCKADVTDVKRRGSAVVATFRLREGDVPGGGCSGTARVRFRFSDGRFAEWRQLPEAPPPDGVIA